MTRNESGLGPPRRVKSTSPASYNVQLNTTTNTANFWMFLIGFAMRPWY